MKHAVLIRRAKLHVCQNTTPEYLTAVIRAPHVHLLSERCWSCIPLRYVHRDGISYSFLTGPLPLVATEKSHCCYIVRPG